MCEKKEEKKEKKKKDLVSNPVNTIRFISRARGSSTIADLRKPLNLIFQINRFYYCILELCKKFSQAPFPLKRFRVSESAFILFLVEIQTTQQKLQIDIFYAAVNCPEAFIASMTALLSGNPPFSSFDQKTVPTEEKIQQKQKDFSSLQ